ncbi:MAG: serine/threonine protein kinase [Myxococcales bacterium]|nr:serine/threonine protein kinase [Myxococcales bacterium]
MVTREWAPVPGPILDDDDDDASEAGGLGGRSPSELAETQLSGPGSTLVSGQIPGSQPPLAGRFGRFVLLRALGGGGMGTVYAAFDEELARRVAIKVLHREACLPPLLLRAEAQAMARLSHPNVVQVYELGEQQGQLFLVMEYVEGETLGEWLELAETRPWTAVLELFIAAGEGLAAAHRAGLVHRDFKPDNVLVDKEGVPRVADFGLARLERRGQRDDRRDPGLHGPGAAPGRADRRPLGHLRLRGRALRGAPRRAALRRRELRGAPRRGGPRRGPAGACPLAGAGPPPRGPGQGDGRRSGRADADDGRAPRRAPELRPPRRLALAGPRGLGRRPRPHRGGGRPGGRRGRRADARAARLGRPGGGARRRVRGAGRVGLPVLRRRARGLVDPPGDGPRAPRGAGRRLRAPPDPAPAR